MILNPPSLDEVSNQWHHHHQLSQFPGVIHMRSARHHCLTAKFGCLCLVSVAACASQLLAKPIFHKFNASVAIQPASAAALPPASVENAPQDDYSPEEWTISIFATFIEDLGLEDLGSKKAIRDGLPLPLRPDYAKAIGIRADEEQQMEITLLDAFYQIRDVDQQAQQINEKILLKYDPELAAKLNELHKEPPKIFKEAVAKLRQQLGPETFYKVNVYLCSSHQGCKVLTPSIDSSN
jgi:hypothetical protein